MSGVWAFIDPQARNAPIWAPGKKWETLTLEVEAKGPSPRNSQEGRLIYGGTSSLRSLQPNFVKLLALFDPLSVALSRVPFSPAPSQHPLNPSRVRSRVLGVRNCGRARVLTRGRPRLIAPFNFENFLFTQSPSLMTMRLP